MKRDEWKPMNWEVVELKVGRRIDILDIVRELA